MKQVPANFEIGRDLCFSICSCICARFRPWTQGPEFPSRGREKFLGTFFYLPRVEKIFSSGGNFATLSQQAGSPSLSPLIGTYVKSIEHYHHMEKVNQKMSS